MNYTLKRYINLNSILDLNTAMNSFLIDDLNLYSNIWILQKIFEEVYEETNTNI